MVATRNARKQISFGGFLLNQPPYVVDSVRVHSLPPRNVQRFDRLVRPGAIVSQAEYAEKVIEINGRIVRQNKLSLASMELLLDRLKAALTNGRQDLIGGFQDERFYHDLELSETLEVTWDEVTQPEISWRALMLAVDPFAYSASVSSVVDSAALANVAGLEYSKTVTLSPGGSAPAWPRFRIDVPVAGPYGMTRLWLVNSTPLSPTTLEIDHTFAANDLIIIDAEAGSVTINGVAKVFNGAIPTIDPRLGPNALELHVFATSTPTLTFTATWRDRYF